MTREASRETDFIFVVHGSNAHTWWRRLANGGYPWWMRWSLFCDAVRKAFNGECVIREHVWSGRNSHEARTAAGAALAARIQAECGNDRVHIIGHSHGGNVALVAANHLPPSRIDNIVLLANPHISVADQEGRRQWPYWGEAARHARHIWNLYSPQDPIQTSGVRLFHGMPPVHRSSLHVERTYEGPQRQLAGNGSVSWKGAFAGHPAMHSSAMGAVTGCLLRGMSFDAAMTAAQLDLKNPNEVRDRGGFGGVSWAQERIRGLTDPGAFDLGTGNRDVGILLIHGFTASPSEMRPLANFIHGRTGWRCKAPLLPGHGTSVRDMEATGAQDWQEAVSRAYQELSKQCRDVFVIGLSLGAILSCHLAFREHGKDSRLAGLVLLAPAFGVAGSRALGLRILRRFRRRRSKGPRAAHYFLDRGLFSYTEMPMDRAIEVLRLGRQAWDNLDRLKEVPTLMVAGELDRNVSLERMHSAARRNPWIRYVRLPRSRHILTVEPDRTVAFEAIMEFLEKILAPSEGNR